MLLSLVLTLLIATRYQTLQGTHGAGYELGIGLPGLPIVVVLVFGFLLFTAFRGLR